MSYEPLGLPAMRGGVRPAAEPVVHKDRHGHVTIEPAVIPVMTPVGVVPPNPPHALPSDAWTGRSLADTIHGISPGAPIRVTGPSEIPMLEGHPHRIDECCGVGCPPPATTLPTDKQARKEIPLCTGVLDYFPAALAEVAKVSKAGNDQHNPGQELHHARGKSMDHPDCIMRHLAERGTIDTDGQRHTAKMVWRALALLQEELEREGAPLARAARVY